MGWGGKRGWQAEVVCEHDHHVCLLQQLRVKGQHTGQLAGREHTTPWLQAVVGREGVHEHHLGAGWLRTTGWVVTRADCSGLHLYQPLRLFRNKCYEISSLSPYPPPSTSLSLSLLSFAFLPFLLFLHLLTSNNAYITGHTTLKGRHHHIHTHTHTHTQHNTHTHTYTT